MIPLVLGMLLGLQAQPQAADGSATPREGGWLPLDGIAAQAGDGVVTLSQLDQRVQARLQEQLGPQPLNDPAQFEDLQNRLSLEGVLDLLTEELEAQAGQDMGLDPDEIERLIRFQIRDERRREGAGSAVDQLLAEGLDPLEDTDQRTRQLYRIYWTRSKLGYSGPAGERPTVDRFIRPGELKLIYRSNRDGLNPPRVRLQMIVMPIAAAGGLDAATKTMEEARSRALAGEDFGDLVDQFSSEGRDTRGVYPWQAVNALFPIPVPVLQDWAARAPVDDISPIVQLPPAGEVQWLLLARMHDRQDTAPPAFEDEGVQTQLRRVFANIRDHRILDYQRALLGDAAYSWLHPRLQGVREALQARRGR